MARNSVFMELELFFQCLPELRPQEHLGKPGPTTALWSKDMAPPKDPRVVSVPVFSMRAYLAGSLLKKLASHCMAVGMAALPDKLSLAGTFL